MKTKHTLISVLMILAIVSTLCVVMAAPAAADVSQPTVPTFAAGEDQIGTASDWTAMTFTIGKLLDNTLGDVVIMTFPTGWAITAAANIAISADADLNFAATSVSGNIVTFAVGSAGDGLVPAGTTLTVTTDGTNKVTNPTTPGSTTYTVRTSQEPTPIASAAFTIKGIKVTGGPSPLAPTTAAAGTTMTVVGAGYTPGQSIDILLGTAVVAPNTTTVGADGTFTATFVQTIAGNITARDVTGLTRNAVAVSLLPSITISPTTGLVGATAVVTGRNFTSTVAAETITVTIGGVAAGTITKAAASTTFTGTITVPSTTGGAKTVLATAGTSGDTATAAFTGIGQTLTLSPSSATAGATITASGIGFKALEYVTITYGAVTKTTMAGADGAYSTTFGVPTGGATGIVTATGVTSAATASATLTITTATLAISPSMGAVGTSVAVTGTGLTPLTNFSVLFTDTGTTMVTILTAVTTNSIGGFNTTVTIPAASTTGGTISITPAGGTIALPFVVTAGTVPVAVSDGLSTIAGKFSIVWTFDGSIQDWKLYDTAAGATSTLSTLTRGQGYYVKVSENCTLAYGGNTYTLYTGWNLIGWLG